MEIPFDFIIKITSITLLIIVTIFQFIIISKVFIQITESENILSQGTDKNFTILEKSRKSKNLIDQRIITIIEQLEDSEKHTKSILAEKEQIVLELKDSNITIDNIQAKLSKEIIVIKTAIIESLTTLNVLLADISQIKISSQLNIELLGEIAENYSELETNITSYNNPVKKSLHINDEEILRSLQLIDSITQLYDNAENTEDLLKGVFKGIDNIRDVTGIINEVAEKTSILSLNAAIESAHAGEAGKGFAIVAEEIRVLAETTAEHAEDINNALYSVSDLINQSTHSEELDKNTYPAIISDMKIINNSLHDIKKLLHPISQIHNLDSYKIKSDNHDFSNLIDKSLKALTLLKAEMSQSVEKVGNLVLIKDIPIEKIGNETDSSQRETGIKPVHSQDLVGL